MRMMPEFRLFCLAVRRPQREEDIAALSREIAAEPDWNCLIEGARRHRVAPLLLAGQQACRSPHLPTTVVAGLRQQALAAAKRGLVQTREISRLSRIFSQAEIRILALKGVVLSAQLFGDAGVRNPRDIDLLADPNEFARAEALLIEAGYRRSGPILSPRQTAAYRRWVKDTGYLHTAAGINVELHHRLSTIPPSFLSTLPRCGASAKKCRLPAPSSPRCRAPSPALSVRARRRSLLGRTALAHRFGGRLAAARRNGRGACGRPRGADAPCSDARARLVSRPNRRTSPRQGAGRPARGAPRPHLAIMP